jgi:hypothetical protein
MGAVFGLGDRPRLAPSPHAAGACNSLEALHGRGLPERKRGRGFLSGMALGCAWALTEISRKSSTVGVLYAYSNYICEK